MPGQDMTLMNAMLRKMDWAESRQKVIAQNIANADTPHYQPQDIAEPDFRSMLESTTSRISLGAASLATTNSKHMQLGGHGGTVQAGEPKTMRNTYETSPSGNAVVLEEQLLKQNMNAADHMFISNLYQKNIDMLKASSRSQ